MIYEFNIDAKLLAAIFKSEGIVFMNQETADRAAEGIIDGLNDLNRLYCIKQRAQKAVDDAAERLRTLTESVQEECPHPVCDRKYTDAEYWMVCRICGYAVEQVKEKEE